MGARQVLNRRCEHHSAQRQRRCGERLGLRRLGPPFDRAAARILATCRISEDASLDDALITAVAQSADMTLVTR